MKLILNVLFLALLFVVPLSAQELTREQKIGKISELRAQIENLEKDFLLPDENDVKLAEKQGFSVFRILPHENSGGKLALYGDGAYYSFARKTNEYGFGSDIKLNKGNLEVGFAGADYGFIYDLQEIPLADVTKESGAVIFLANYKPPTIESEVRSEQKKARNYETESITYKADVPAIVGNTYVLRSINFSRSDILVAFKILRKDTDGSLIIFWKLLENFEKPLIAKNQ
jgi:hypothetical protein